MERTMEQKFKSRFLNTLKERGFVQDCTDFAGLDEYLSGCENAGKAGVAYIGFDCTATSLHVGSLMQIMILRHLRNSGHKAIVLLGGGTTKIGDPTGKDEARKVLTDEAIELNKAGIKKVFDTYLGQYEMVDNDEWLSKINYIQFLRDVGRYFSVNRMLSMDSVKLRIEREQELSFLEFNYMILQAYDFVELNKKYGCRLQMGGSDQWGNIVNGTDLQRRLSTTQDTINIKLKSDVKKNELIPYLIKHHSDERFSGKKLLMAVAAGFTNEAGYIPQGTQATIAVTYYTPAFGLTTPLLTTASGAKMGKTADGAVWLDADMLKPYDYWQFWRNASDADVEKFLKLFTELSLEDIAAAMSGNINEAKKLLANKATEMLHGEQAAKDAEETARKVFEQGGIGGDLPTIEVEAAKLDAGIAVAQLFTEAGLTASNGEAKKLVQGGGIKINDEKVSDIGFAVNSSHLKDGVIKLSAGKKKHALVKVK